MIVYDLRCRKGHVFEAWFRDSAAYEEQPRAEKVVCPTCGSKKVDKAPMAPRVAKGRSREQAQGKADQATAETEKAGQAMRVMRELRRKVEENFDYVGPDFAEEARRIHYGEADPHNIYGETSDKQARQLNEEGISFGRIPWTARHDS